MTFHRPAIMQYFKMTRMLFWRYSFGMKSLFLIVMGAACITAHAEVIDITLKINLTYRADGYTAGQARYPNPLYDSPGEAFAAAKKYWDHCEPSASGEVCYTALNLRPYFPNKFLVNGSPSHYTSDIQICGTKGCSVVDGGYYGAISIDVNVTCPKNVVGYRGGSPVHFSLTETGADASGVYKVCDARLEHQEPCADCEAHGDPVDPSTGQMFQIETDYASADGGLKYERTYRSTGNGFASALTSGLIDYSTISREIKRNYCENYFDGIITHFFCWQYIGNGAQTYHLLNANGRLGIFHGPKGSIAATADVNDKLFQRVNTSGVNEWVVNRSDNNVEIYNTNGTLQRKTALRGQREVTYTYSDTTTPVAIAPHPDMLIRLSDTFGRKLNFTYDASGRLTGMTDPAGGVYQYAYDGVNNLSSVTYPGGSKRKYLYGEAANINNGTPCNDRPEGFSTALTGIIDENNVRFATIKYQCDGAKTTSSEHAGGVFKYSFVYGTGTNSVTSSETDPLGTERQYNYSSILSGLKLISATEPAPNGSTKVSRSGTYDANGNPATRIDFNGHVTTFKYDLSRNLETSRTEAFGTPMARTITTEWHPTYRLPKRIAEPLLITTMTHDRSGNVLTRTLQATTDVNGSKGFSANTTGRVRTWAYTWNTYGQMLTATGPRTDVADVTTYTYETGTGNLATVTNAAGQVTKLSAYDANGRVGSIQDPNGSLTTLTYYPRGWLRTSSTQAADASTTFTTTYTYDGVGQLKTVTLPTGAAIIYSYDDAHRLYEIKDSQNNKITYALDNMGNHISETVTDPNGALKRSVTRAFDALNRIQFVVGAAQ